MEYRLGEGEQFKVVSPAGRAVVVPVPAGDTSDGDVSLVTDEALLAKADLVNGVVPVQQLPVEFSGDVVLGVMVMSGGSESDASGSDASGSDASGSDASGSDAVPVEFLVDGSPVTPSSGVLYADSRTGAKYRWADGRYVPVVPGVVTSVDGMTGDVKLDWSGKADLRNGAVPYDQLPADAQPVSWVELRRLHHHAQLVPGRRYRITDYVASVGGDDAQRAVAVTDDGRFDIVVTALAPDLVSENAVAFPHEGDSAFRDHVAGWQIKYCMFNDSTRFSWANPNMMGNSGYIPDWYEYDDARGVVYWMRDDYGNEAPFDFKSIKFKPFVPEDYFPYRPDAELSVRDMLDPDVHVYAFGDKGARDGGSDVYPIYGNVIQTWNRGGKLHLPYVHFSTGCDNFVGAEASDCSFLGHCVGNRIGENVRRCFMSDCSDCRVGSRSQDVCLGMLCHGVKVGEGCRRCFVAHGSCACDIGALCRDITFGTYVQSIRNGNVFDRFLKLQLGSSYVNVRVDPGTHHVNLACDPRFRDELASGAMIAIEHKMERSSFLGNIVVARGASGAPGDPHTLVSDNVNRSQRVVFDASDSVNINLSAQVPVVLDLNGGTGPGGETVATVYRSGMGRFYTEYVGEGTVMDPLSPTYDSGYDELLRHGFAPNPSVQSVAPVTPPSGKRFNAWFLTPQTTGTGAVRVYVDGTVPNIGCKLYAGWRNAD